MSRAKKKMAIVHDLQGSGDVVLTKRDCDLIVSAIDLYDSVNRSINGENVNGARELRTLFKSLTYPWRKKRNEKV